MVCQEMSGFSCFFILFAGGPEFGEKHLGLATGSARGLKMPKVDRIKPACP